jgi:hypothetical protein
MPKAPKPKPVNYDLIPQTDAAYKLLEEVRDKWHEDMYGAKIALAYRKRLKRDKDGLLMLGRCIKVSDLQKEFIPFDFIILLNREVWQDIGFNKKKKLALLDHEMCHATLSLNKDLERTTDEKGRTVYRVRHHDIEEFRSVVEHHGCYKADLVKFAESLLKKQGTAVLPGLEAVVDQVNAGALDHGDVKVRAEIVRHEDFYAAKAPLLRMRQAAPDDAKARLLEADWSCGEGDSPA